ncbi:Undecaprenyl-phosphate alpha-N-acetylglucosaminyl 1-phosphate transferase [invertebrate metagenome]|uniref:Undecaprenyl-phosphate alpha-N-acetylglucosaminyl 1-phosphate transferase n=1 Tax=invertebrate metagenome TaxID=1711999 RepID=A0A2H9TAM6_9ZZZZ
MLLKFLLVFTFSIVVIKLLRPLAVCMDLLDKPDARKHHHGNVPLVGGIVIYLCVVVAGAVFGKTGYEYLSWCLGAGILTLVGALDDRLSLRKRYRILAEISAGLLMVFGAGIVILDLGNLLGLGNIYLPMALGMVFTVVAVIGVINAINMSDGIDGLAASLCLLSICSFLILIGQSGSVIIPIIPVVGALTAFLLCNLQVAPGIRKIFLGDAGSMMLGYTLVWLLVRFSQEETHISQQFAPVTALFVLGLPLMDMVSTVSRRAFEGKNPFIPDRSHFHHLLQDIGLNSRQTLMTVLFFASGINAIGLLCHFFAVQQWIQLMIFLLCFIGYCQFSRVLSRRSSEKSDIIVNPVGASDTAMTDSAQKRYVQLSSKSTDATVIKEPSARQDAA